LCFNLDIIILSPLNVYVQDYCFVIATCFMLGQELQSVWDSGVISSCLKGLRMLQLDTNSRLADRVDNIRILKDLLERSAAALEREIGNLNEAKQNLEYALDQRVGLAIHINVENLVSREGRRDGDLVEDVVEVELHKVE